MRRNFILVVSWLVLIGIEFLTASGTTDPATGPLRVVVTDSLGREIGFEKPPERILLAGKAVVFAVNAMYMFPEAGKVVIGTGVTDQGLGDFYPILDDGAAEKFRFANSAGPEQLLSADPDVVILKSYLRSTLGHTLEELKVPVLYLDLETPDSFLADVTRLGILVGNETRADEIVEYFTTRRERIEKRTLGAEAPRVLLVSHTARDGDTAYSVPAAEWLQTELVESGGGVAVWKDDMRTSGWAKVNLEQVAVWRPEYIFVVSYGSPASEAASVLDRGLGLPGARVLPFPADFHSWDQPDPRWILGLLWIARTLHPDLFPDVDMREEVITFYQVLYNLDMDVIEREILPRLSGTAFGE